MSALRDLQMGFAQHLQGPSAAESPSDFIEQVVGTGLSAERRLSIYANNSRWNLIDYLRSVYPVIERLVGSDFFTHSAVQYLARYPSRSGNLHEFGHRLAEFLADLPATAELYYLPEVAKLEWACHQVYYAPDHQPLDPQRFAELPEARYGDLRLLPSSASVLIASRYPLLDIWRVNQPDYVGDQTVHLDTGGVSLLIIRLQFHVQIQSLEPGEFALLTALAEQLSFIEACERALQVQPDYNVVAGFRHHVLQGTWVDFEA